MYDIAKLVYCCCSVCVKIPHDTLESICYTVHAKYCKVLGGMTEHYSTCVLYIHTVL